MDFLLSSTSKKGGKEREEEGRMRRRKEGSTPRLWWFKKYAYKFFNSSPQKVEPDFPAFECGLDLMTHF